MITEILAVAGWGTLVFVGLRGLLSGKPRRVSSHDYEGGEFHFLTEEEKEEVRGADRQNAGNSTWGENA